MFMMSATNSASTSKQVRASSGAEAATTDENYTIVDFVEPGPTVTVTTSSSETKNVTSTPRFPGNDATALKDLDKLLDSGSSTASEAGSSSSSSRRNSN